MTATPDPILFQAVCTPPSSFSRGGYRALVLLLGGGACLPAILFLAMGAWPVLGFLVPEVALVLVLVARQARWARRAQETLVLTAAGLTVTVTDHRGRCRSQRLDPYWARVEQDGAGRLALVQRGRRIPIGGHLGVEDRAALGAAIDAALAHHRAPSFDNPQLR